MFFCGKYRLLLENSNNNNGILSDGTNLSNVLTTATLFGSEAVLKYLLEKRIEFRKLVNMPAKVVVDIFGNL